MAREQIAPRWKSFRNYLTIAGIALLVIAAGMIWWNYYYVFGEGVKSGQLNYVVKKGNIFKTYEGKLIQVGLRSASTGTIQSNEFEFSVENDSIANVLMLNSGKTFDLHYREYKHAIPWRGFSVFVVDSIIEMRP
ncbi:hypothetical protein [Parapedobacter indicus]|uniref:6-phosphogluconate dehydrogenase n=1 Tax=Parapedobacter indicus TaxID=1477437 RepID=A0A1I3UXW7_9SPHI|nr:hypothetical protein [Parapedobacter indicus]PPK99076.1 hypothetical protein CLV26_115109 [Parapedobacter indicus]SFJ86711.1 hypothetical protein SAMN05444682_11569 [Parapedobacter indicus]